MRNRFGMTLALTAMLSLGGMALANTPRTAKPQNSNSAGTATTASHTMRHHKRRHHKRRHARRRAKAAAAANANR